MGADEVIEIEKLVDDNGDITISRGLLYFDHIEVSKSLSDRSISLNVVTASIILKNVETRGISSEYKIDAFQVSGNWDRGNGRKYDDNEYTYAGVTWLLKNNQISGSWTQLGGDMYPTSCSQNFTNNHTDIKMDITQFLSSWMSGDIKNDGILLKLSDESSSVDYGKIRFFSENTNTIYYPYLDIMWDGSTKASGSATGSYLPSSDLSTQRTIIIENVEPSYNSNEEVRFNVFARNTYIKKTFQKWPQYNYPYHDYYDKHFLPDNSYYSIIDNLTGEAVIEFDSGTKISSDSSGSFFVCNMNFPVNRSYRMLIKTVENGIVNIYNNTPPFLIE
jgi:hypothetical protein